MYFCSRNVCSLLLLYFLAASTAPRCVKGSMEQAAVGELFTYKIEPVHFNWTHQVMSEQFRYRPALEYHADLPSWMRYMYSYEYHAGFLYGTPPDSWAGRSLRLTIIALNKQNYEARRIVLPIYITTRFPAPNVIQMKIDNLNWVHLMDPGRVENLLNIFRKDLWPECSGDLSLVFMESAVNMGGRLPLKPQQREGVIVHLGSFAQFSLRLKELQEEVRPLYKLPSCTYKRTSVQKLFENAGFKLDWCAFKMIGVEISPEILFHNHGIKNYVSENMGVMRSVSRWQGMGRADAPTRNYIDEFAIAFAIPGVLLAIFLGILSAIFCFQHPALFDPESEFFFNNVFEICQAACQRAATSSSKADDDDVDDVSETSVQYPTSSTVQMVQCSDTNTNQPVTTLKSLRDPHCLLDNISMRSQSPNNSFYQNESPPHSYQRPKPPPYKGGTLSRSGVDI